MPSTPPPLPRSADCSTPLWISPQEQPFHNPDRINWSTILTSASLAFALVAGIVAWIITHPRQATLPAMSLGNPIVESTVEPLSLPQSPLHLVTETFHRSHPREAIGKHIPLMEDDPPPLPPPGSPRVRPLRSKDMERPPWQAPQDDLVREAPQKPAGETYGTQVLFHNKQTVAADLARREHKLLFVMHISGNFEDSCFT